MQNRFSESRNDAKWLKNIFEESSMAGKTPAPSPEWQKSYILRFLTRSLILWLAGNCSFKFSCFTFSPGISV